MKIRDFYKQIDDCQFELDDWVMWAGVADLFEELGEVGMTRGIRWMIENRKYPWRMDSAVPTYLWIEGRALFLGFRWKVGNRIPDSVYAHMCKSGTRQPRNLHQSLCDISLALLLDEFPHGVPVTYFPRCLLRKDGADQSFDPLPLAALP